MTHDARVDGTTTDRRPVLESTARWCGRLAVVAALFAAGLLVQWANRYYIASVFSPGPAETLDEGRYAYDLLASAHDTLLDAVVAMLLVGVLVVARAWLRSDAGPRTSLRQG